MSKIHFSQIKGADAAKKLKIAGDLPGEHPGATLVTEPGDYIKNFSEVEIL